MNTRIDFDKLAHCLMHLDYDHYTIYKYFNKLNPVLKDLDAALEVYESGDYVLTEAEAILLAMCYEKFAIYNAFYDRGARDLSYEQASIHFDNSLRIINNYVLRGHPSRAIHYENQIRLSRLVKILDNIEDPNSANDLMQEIVSLKVLIGKDDYIPVRFDLTLTLAALIRAWAVDVYIDSDQSDLDNKRYRRVKDELLESIVRLNDMPDDISAKYFELAEAHSCLAQLYAKRKTFSLYELAGNSWNTSLHIWKKYNEANNFIHPRTGITNYLMSHIFDKTDAHLVAITLLEKAEKILRGYYKIDCAYDIMLCTYALGNSYHKLNKYDKAFKKHLYAHEISKKLENNDMQIPTKDAMDSDIDAFIGYLENKPVYDPDDYMAYTEFVHDELELLYSCLPHCNSYQSNAIDRRIKEFERFSAVMLCRRALWVNEITFKDDDLYDFDKVVEVKSDEKNDSDVDTEAPTPPLTPVSSPSHSPTLFGNKRVRVSPPDEKELNHFQQSV